MNDLIKKTIVVILVVLGMFQCEFAHAFTTIMQKSYKDIVEPAYKTTRLGDRGYHRAIQINEVGIKEDEHFKGRYFFDVPGYWEKEGPYRYAYLRYPTYYIFPSGSKVDLKIDTLETIEVPYDLTYGRIPILEEEPDSATIPSGKYITGKFSYPTSPVEIVNKYERNGVLVVAVEENMVLCNSYGKDVRVVSKLSYSLNTTNSTNRIEIIDAIQKQYANGGFLPEIREVQLISKGIFEKPRKDESMLIISTPDFQEAVNLFSQWKKTSGYNVKVEQRSSWTPETVLAAVQKFSTDNQDTVVIVGDHGDVPGMKSKVIDKTHITDYYYGFRKGNTGLIPNFHLGRIPVSSSDEAINTVYKIISAEKNPPVDSLFYSNYSIAAYFQSDSNNTSHEIRTYLTTSEKIRDYLVNEQDKKVERIYKADKGVTPKTFNDNTSLPAELLSPQFNWNQRASEIISSFNTGKSLIIHRDHGTVEGWYEPNFTIKNLSGLNT